MNACTRCDEYLAFRRPALLRPIGLWVQRSGKPPRNIVESLVRHFHKRGHRL